VKDLDIKADKSALESYRNIFLSMDESHLKTAAREIAAWLIEEPALLPLYFADSVIELTIVALFLYELRVNHALLVAFLA
jgi:hypothetical protein